MKIICVLAVTLFSLTLPSCAIPSSHEALAKPFPTKSFVQVEKIMDIKQCKKDAECRIGKFKSTGSGTSIAHYADGSIILTAGHVCNTTLNPVWSAKLEKHSVYLRVVSTSGKAFKSRVVSYIYNPKDPRDLCILHVPNLKLPIVKMSKTPPKRGKMHYAMAAPKGIFHPPTVPLLHGIYSGHMEDRVNDLYTIPSAGGSSGAAILNDRMEIVGVIFAAVKDFHHVTIAVGHKGVVDFLDENLPKKTR